MLRSIRFATLSTLVALVGCSDDGGDSTGAASETDEGSGSSTTMLGTTTEASTSEESTTGMSEGPVYRAEFVAGTPNELRILQRDDEAGRCTWLILTDQALGLLAVSAPSGWSTRTAYTNTRPSSCEGDPGSSGSSQVSNGSGSVTAASEGTLAPCTLDVEATLQFTSESFTATFSAQALEVAGCQ